jgi:thioesterase domain-containing protein
VAPGIECASFVRHLGLDQPVFGVRLPALQGSAVPSLEEVAGMVVREIRRTRPHGPYAFAGWCAAGLVGLEIARHMDRAGEEVAFAALFDARTVFLPRTNFALGLWVRLCRLQQRVAFFLWRTMKYGFQPLRVALKNRADSANRASRRVRGVEAPQLIGQSLQLHHPAPWNGRVVHIWAEERPRGRFRDPEFAWSGVSPHGFKFYEVPGDHLTMLQEPAVAKVALLLSRELRAAKIKNAAAGGDLVDAF